MTTYRPEMWVVLEIKYQTQTIYKILTTSYGGYTQGDSWKLSSGIESLSIEGDDYVMPNSSGSIYYCPKNLMCYKMGSYTRSIYNGWLQNEMVGRYQIRILDYSEIPNLNLMLEEEFKNRPTQ